MADQVLSNLKWLIEAEQGLSGGQQVIRKRLIKLLAVISKEKPVDR